MELWWYCPQMRVHLRPGVRQVRVRWRSYWPNRSPDRLLQDPGSLLWGPLLHHPDWPPEERPRLVGTRRSRPRPGRRDRQPRAQRPHPYLRPRPTPGTLLSEWLRGII